jgi:plastocyanin
MRHVRSIAAVMILLGCGGGGTNTAPSVFTSLSISPSSATLFTVAPGASVTLVATPKDQFGKPMPGLGSATFASANDAVVSVGAQTGLATGVAAGGPVDVTASLTAAGTTKQATAQITVAVPPATVTVVAGNPALTFTPQQADIANGGVVTFSFGGLAHSVQFDGTAPTCAEGNCNVGVTTTGAVTRTFTTSGTFAYHCTVHGTGMNGTIVVHCSRRRRAGIDNGAPRRHSPVGRRAAPEPRPPDP